MTITLPTRAEDMLNGKHHAQLIAGTSDAAFWMYGRDDRTALFLLNQVHGYFHQMANALGYDVTPRPALDAAQSATLTILVDAAE